MILISKTMLLYKELFCTIIVLYAMNNLLYYVKKFGLLYKIVR